MATALNNALSENIGFECVYYEALKRRLGEIESGFLRPNKEVAVVNKVMISPAIRKSMVEYVYMFVLCVCVWVCVYVSVYADICYTAKD